MWHIFSEHGQRYNESCISTLHQSLFVCGTDSITSISPWKLTLNESWWSSLKKMRPQYSMYNISAHLLNGIWGYLKYYEIKHKMKVIKGRVWSRLTLRLYALAIPHTNNMQSINTLYFRQHHPDACSFTEITKICSHCHESKWTFGPDFNKSLWAFMCYWVEDHRIEMRSHWAWPLTTDI